MPSMTPCTQQQQQQREKAYKALVRTENLSRLLYGAEQQCTVKCRVVSSDRSRCAIGSKGTNRVLACGENPT